MTYPGKCIVGESLGFESDENTIIIEMAKDFVIAMQNVIDSLRAAIGQILEFVSSVVETVYKCIYRIVELLIKKQRNRIVIHKMNLHNKKRRKR